MKRYLLALIVGLSVVVSTKAQDVEITTTGATAFRAVQYFAVRNLFLEDNAFVQNPPHGNVSYPNPESSNRVYWQGTISRLFGNRVVRVRTSQSGSIAGIGTLTSGATVTYLNSTTPGVFTTTPLNADFAFSDVFQESTATLEPALVDNIAGIIPFIWTRGFSCSTKVVNVTAKLAEAIYNVGYLPLKMFTGVGTDTGIVNTTGRNSGSGTRGTILSEIGFGALATVTQRKVSGGNWVADGVGYSSNSGITADLVQNVSTSAQGTGGSIGWLDISDSDIVVNHSLANGGNAARLSWNGVPYSKTNVQEGLYSGWGYEHLYHTDAIEDGSDEQIFRDALLQQIDDDLATSTFAIQSSSMKVIRLADGARITP